SFRCSEGEADLVILQIASQLDGALRRRDGPGPLGAADSALHEAQVAAVLFVPRQLQPDPAITIIPSDQPRGFTDGAGFGIHRYPHRRVMLGDRKSTRLNSSHV